MKRQLLTIGIAMAISCGGKAVIDPGGGGSSGSGASGSGASGSGANGSGASGNVTVGPGSGGSTSSVVPPTCDQLVANLQAALADAQACDACDDGPDPCDYFSGIELTDSCGCPAAINFTNMEAVENAVEAFNAWASQCEILDCQVPCGVTQDPTCTQSAPGCVGTCDFNP